MVQCTVLADNTVATGNPWGLRGEWGFSVAVGDILFDTGQSDLARRNANLLNMSVQFESIVLSHTHFDHTGGLLAFLSQMNEPTVYLHPAVWEPRYMRDENVPVGIPFAKETIVQLAEVVEHREPVEVADDIRALGEIPRQHGNIPAGKIKESDTLVEDNVVDDQALAVQTEDGIALVLGCCHSGLRNTIEYAEEVCDDDVRYVIGGTHLVALDEAEVHEIADWLEDKLTLFAGTHCTGFEAEAILKQRLPDAFESVGVGTTLEIGSGPP